MRYLLLAVMTLFNSAGAIFLKKASGSESILALIKNKNIYLGVVLYLSGMAINIYLLKIMEYSLVMPLGSLTYIWTLILSKTFLGESITKRKIIGIAGIMAGVAILSL